MITPFTHPKDCTPAIANIERCWNGDANRIRLTVPGVQSAMVFDKIRFRAILKDDACALSANPLPVKGMAHSPVYGHVVITGRMLYEEEAVLPLAGNTRPFSLEILPQNTTIDGTAYDTVQALYDALQAVITDCDCICDNEQEQELVARMLSIYINEGFSAATVDTTGSVGAYIRISYEKNGGNDPDVDGPWESNTGSNQVEIDLAEFTDPDTTAIRIEVSPDMLVLGNVVTALFIGDTLYLPQPAIDINYPVDEFLGACVGAKNFEIILSSVVNNGINAATGIFAVDENAAGSQFAIISRSCSGNLDYVHRFLTTLGSVRISSLDIVQREIGATSNLPGTGYNLLLQYSGNGVSWNDCQDGDVPYGSGSQTDTYVLGPVNNGGFLKCIFSRIDVAGLPLTYTDVKQIPFPQITGGNGPGTYAFSFVAGGVDSSHADYTGHSFRNVKLNITGGTYAGTHAIPDFAEGDIPDISGLPAGLQALLTVNPNIITIDDVLWLAEGATFFSASCIGTNEYGAIIISSDTVTGSYTP